MSGVSGSSPRCDVRDAALPCGVALHAEVNGRPRRTQCISAPGEPADPEAIDVVPVPDDSNTALNVDEFATIILDVEAFES